MSDPMATMNLDDSAYDELLKDADTDGRLGDREALVASVTHDTWPSGDPRIKVKFVLTDARNAAADLTISPPPSPEVVKAEKASWEPGKLRAIANTVSMYRQLATNYGISPDQIKEGDVFRIKTVKTKRLPDGSGGFVRCVAFLAKDGSVATGSTAAPF